MREKLFDPDSRGQERKSFDVETIMMAADIFPRRSNHFPNSILSRIHFVFCQVFVFCEVFVFCQVFVFVKNAFCGDVELGEVTPWVGID